MMGWDNAAWVRRITLPYLHLHSVARGLESTGLPHGPRRDESDSRPAYCVHLACWCPPKSFVFRCSSEVVEGLHLPWARLSRLLGGRVEREALSESLDWSGCSPVETRLSCIGLAQAATPVALV